MYIRKRILVSLSVAFVLNTSVSLAQTQVPSNIDILPPIYSLLMSDELNESSIVNAVINPSRTDCASPCTVVFSADKTTAQGLDSHGIWSQLSYHWDFDTDETDTFGSLYDQTYTYVNGDTAYEKGHVPMVTKTFLCETGTCAYNVGMRAQNAAGEFNDDFVVITVKSESSQWSVAQTICVSNTLDISSDWTNFSKACPLGAIKQASLPLPDQFDGKLVLVKRGDVFDADDISPARRLAIQNGQSNYKIGNFGNGSDPFPDIQAIVNSGIATYQMSAGVITSINPRPRDSDVAVNGWTSNAYFEGLRIGGFNFPESFRHIGLHDIDMDMETSPVIDGGRIGFSGGVRCTDHPTFLDCANVPFPKGGYISKVDVVGGTTAETNSGTGLNVAGIGCSMVNFTGIVDSQFRKAAEHNLRIMGWWRINLMRNFFRGEHYAPVKQKVTLRGCFDDDLDAGLWQSVSDLPANWQTDPEGRTRADTFLDNGTDQYAHTNRYQVVAGNVMGDASILGSRTGGTQYQTNASSGDQPTFLDIVLTQNTFVNDGDRTSGSNISASAHYIMCVDNTYSTPSIGCFPSQLESRFPGSFREPTPIQPPLLPGSL
ncbi:MAG: hypothetical protein ACRBHB_07580 [Arenicella sp.]